MTIPTQPRSETHDLNEPRAEMLRLTVLVLGGAFLCWQLAVVYVQPTALRNGVGVLLLLAMPSLGIVLWPLYQTLNNIGWIDTYQGLIGPYVAFGIPFSVLLLYAFFIEFPKDLEDAAQLDGCGVWSMLFRVVLPLSMPGLASVAIFQGVFIWNEFLLALITIRSDSLKTLPLGLTTFQGEWATNWPLMLSALTLATLPLLAMYILLQRQFINSLTGFSK